MTDSLKLFLGNKQVLVETNEIPISNNAEESFNDIDTKQSDINKTFKKEIEDRQKNLVNTDNTINLVDNADTNNVDISLNIPESEKIITKSQEGLTTNISLNFDSENNELQLKGKDNQLISSTEIISSIVYRGVFNDIASAKYILADTLANKDVILVITDNQYYQYHSTDGTFTVVNDTNIINNLKSKQDTLSNTDDVKIKDNITVLKDETGNDITDAEGNIIKEVKKNITVKNQSDIKFLGLYKDNTAIENYKDGDIIYNNSTSNYQSFNEDTNTWNDYNNLRTLQSIKSYQTAIRIPENSPLQFSRRLKEGSTVELEEVLTSSFTRYRYDFEYRTYDEVTALPKTQKHNGDIFKLKDLSLLLYVCEPTVDSNYNVTETEKYIYIKDNRRTNLVASDYLKIYNSGWNFSYTVNMKLQNNVVHLSGFAVAQRAPSNLAGGFNTLFWMDPTTIKKGYELDMDYTSYYYNTIVFSSSSSSYPTDMRLRVIVQNRATFEFRFTSQIRSELNNNTVSFCFPELKLPLIKS